MYNFCLLLLMMMMIERSFVLSLGAQTSYRTAAIFGWLLLRLSLPLPLLLLFYRCCCLLILVRLFTRLSGSKFSIKILDFAASLRVCFFFHSVPKFVELHAVVLFSNTQLKVFGEPNDLVFVFIVVVAVVVIDVVQFNALITYNSYQITQTLLLYGKNTFTLRATSAMKRLWFQLVAHTLTHSHTQNTFISNNNAPEDIE